MRSLSGIRSANREAMRQSEAQQKIQDARNDARISRKFLRLLLAHYEAGSVNDNLARDIRKHLEG